VNKASFLFGFLIHQQRQDHIMGIRLMVRVVVLAELLFGIQGFLLLQCPVVVVGKSSTTTTCASPNNNAAEPAQPNKAMEFLRKVGRVGNNQDFTNAIGVDEGPSGKAKGVRYV
jgi:hypothetical protein